MNSISNEEFPGPYTQEKQLSINDLLKPTPKCIEINNGVVYEIRKNSAWPTHPTEEDTDRPYSEGFHQMRRPPNNRKSKEKTDRHYIREEPVVADQSVSNSWAKYINKGEIL